MMTHPQLVRALAKDGRLIAAEMTPSQAHLLHMTIGISGEAGELLDVVKKHVIYQKDLDCENVIEELGDLEFYMEGLRQWMGVTREACVKKNIEKLTRRYGEKYSDKPNRTRN
jgi:NTP pyrophosphatase (non-canonical NTP hydrolase)